MPSRFDLVAVSPKNLLEEGKESDEQFNVNQLVQRVNCEGNEEILKRKSVTVMPSQKQ